MVVHSENNYRQLSSRSWHRRRRRFAVGGRSFPFCPAAASATTKGVYHRAPEL